MNIQILSQLQKNINYLYFQLLTVLNYFLNIYILFILSFFGYPSLTSEGFIIISIISLLTHGLSFNSRNIFLGGSKSISFKNVLKFRLTVGICSIFFSSILIFILLGSENFFFYFSILLITIFTWVAEIIIAKNEIEQKIDKYYYSIIIISIFALPVIIFFSLDKLIFFTLFYCITSFIIFKNTFKFSIYEFFKILKKNFNMFKLGISSSFLKYFSNIIWRYSAFLLIGSEKSGILFLGFAFGSFIGTLFDVSFGASLINNIKYIKTKKIIKFLFAYFLLLSAILYIFNKYSDLNYENIFYLNQTALISIIGGCFMIGSLAVRQFLYKTKKYINICYKIDMIGYILIMFIIPILVFINENYIILSYLISSLFVFIIYMISYKSLIK
tara:strand:- start:4264 stop:5421 length:1158 start_codon:yes stop_codon:yes gene_type:complete